MTSSPTDLFKIGTVLWYDYLWKHEADAAQKRGIDHREAFAKKPRTACVMLAQQRGDGFTHIVLLPISSQPPRTDQRAMEIPETEIRRAGLSEFKRAWITISESNYDIVERSYCFNPNQLPRGRFSLQFMQRIAQAAGTEFLRSAARVDRR